MRSARHEDREVQRALAMWCVVMLVSLAAAADFVNLLS
jgi:hypothetical protein